MKRLLTPTILLVLAGCGSNTIDTSAGQFTVEDTWLQSCADFSRARGAPTSFGGAGGSVFLMQDQVCGGDTVLVVSLAPVEERGFLPDNEPAVVTDNYGKHERIIAPFGNVATVTITPGKQTFEAWFPSSRDATGLKLSWNGGPEVSLPDPQAR